MGIAALFLCATCLLMSVDARAAVVPASLDVRISHSGDDAEEPANGGTVDLSSSDLELVEESVAQSVGLRFTGLSIPQGAAITGAHVQFQVDEASSNPTSLVIQGEAADNAIPFGGGVDSVVSRWLTVASVPWSPPTWANVGQAGAEQRTPDIAAVIQEIVNRPGWMLNNSLVLVVNGVGTRFAEAYDGDPGGAPLLHVDYELMDQEAPVADAGADQTIAIPASANLNGLVTDDGEPNPPGLVTTTWSKYSGTGDVSFANASSVNTAASFSIAGTYVLRLTAVDGERQTHDDVTVIVNPAPAPPVVSAFTPASSQVAMVVTVTGSNFSAADGVFFNGIPATYWIDADNMLHATVPAGASGGLIAVSNPWGFDVSSASFNLIPSPPVLVGAGDITDCGGQEEATAQLLDAIPGNVFTTGDNAYEGATDAIFNDCYDPTWGRHKSRTRPTPGNTDYVSPKAAGYFNYFGAAAGEPGKGYYSYDIDDWHVVNLNSECHEIGGCGRDSPQGIWLRQDLAANPQACTVAIWHHPRYSTAHDEDFRLQDFWGILYDAGAELILNGHDHSYERFAMLDPFGNVDPAGIRQIIVGTGGKSLSPLGAPAPNSLIRNDDSFGVLKVTLNAGGYDWEYVPALGAVFTDSGSDVCRVANQPPVVLAGPDQVIALPASTPLQGDARDDGFPGPAGSLLLNWSQVSGPGTANFVDDTQADTSVSFTEIGRYVLRLTGDDGEHISTDDVQILVTAAGVQVFSSEFRVAASSDDAEEGVPSGSMLLNSSDLELIYDSGGINTAQLTGLRFAGVNVPQGAAILKAYIQFQADEATSGAASLLIEAEATDNSSGFVGAMGNISMRSLTASGVPWSPAPWTGAGLAGEAEQTPDLSRIVQEVTNRPGWSSGNAMSLVFSGSGQRVAESYDGLSAAAPVLVMQYALGINSAPLVNITLPGDGSRVTAGTDLIFTGAASDDVDGDLAAGLNWSSSIDGDLGTGATLNAVLSLGAHSITAAVADSGGKMGSAQITVHVTDAPNVAPGVSIITPLDGASVEVGTPLTFIAAASDDEDGDLSAAVNWTSDIDGDFGIGASVDSSLSVGVHTITASVDDSGGLPASVQVTVTITEVPGVVAIDVLPGDPANVVYPNRAGNLPVAVLSSADFNASTVDPESLRFGLGEATRTGDIEISDVDGQFGNDTTVRFRIQDSGIFCNDTEVSLHGETFSGSPIAGTGTIDATQCETGQCHAY